MSIWVQLVLFGVPGFLVYYGIFYGAPKLVKKGVPLMYAFWLWLWAPIIILLPISLLLFLFVEGGSLSMGSIVERFRLFAIQGKDWMWIGIAVVITLISEQLFEPVSKYLAKLKRFSPPEYLPAPFNPLKKFSMPPKDFFGVELRGNCKLLFVFIPLHLLAMFSEEMMWRGYILPLQENMFGGFAWIVNGMLWAWIVHGGLKWHFISMVPSMLLAPLIAQHTGSTWASFAVHAIPNSLLWILLLMGIINPSPKEDEQAS